MIRSSKYLNGAKGASCKVRIAGVCKDNRETTISAHIRDENTGRGQKASDLSTADCCWDCHEVLDHRAKMPDGTFLTGVDWYFYALRGLQETLQARFEAGLLIVPIDVEPALNDRPIKPRKAKEDRAKIAGRGFPKVSRKFGS